MLIRQPIEYEAVFWDPYHKFDIEKLEKNQRRAARFVQGDYKQTSSVTAMINSLRWLAFEDRRKELRINYLVKIITGKVVVKKITWSQQPADHADHITASSSLSHSAKTASSQEPS